MKNTKICRESGDMLTDPEPGARASITETFLKVFVGWAIAGSVVCFISDSVTFSQAIERIFFQAGIAAHLWFAIRKGARP